ncbi:hypothetical protein [Halpernia sp.]|uniref:hypothetical protein n=1 Tax=Halpernia sp. TaxID=2782209 RepID=UPI003A915909
MKRIILGLILSVGVSGFAFAKNDGNAEHLLKKDVLKVVNCTISTNVKTYDEAGTLIDNRTYTTSGSGSQCDNALDGVVYVMKRMVIKGLTPP